jgi:hypothetical protein
MSEVLGLGASDCESRWIGVRRHQAALAIAGVGLVGEWLTQVHSDVVELVAGLALLFCAAPSKDGLTVGERLRVALNFVTRSRWTSIRVTRSGDATTISARGESTMRGYELQHRGRLDLSGRDRINAGALVDFADAVATSDATRHFSVHVCTAPQGVATFLAIPTDLSPPPNWLRHRPSTNQSLWNATAPGVTWLLERWAYVRDDCQVVRVLRVRDFSSAPVGRALLERLQFATSRIDVAVHVDVVGGVRARRLAARAVHRVGSDDRTSQAAGFRRTAQSSRNLERLRQRESLVVEGAALMRVAVFIVIRAKSLQQLRRDVKTVERTTVESGLRCEPGFGRQALWYCAQLPGGPVW